MGVTHVGPENAAFTDVYYEVSGNDYPATLPHDYRLEDCRPGGVAGQACDRARYTSEPMSSPNRRAVLGFPPHRAHVHPGREGQAP